MPFLTLNGVTIPTKEGGEIKVTEYGERTAGYDGSAQIDVRARKREWQFTTKPISHIRARALEGLVQGNGLYLPFDFYGGTNTGIYSTNGIYPTSSTGGTAVYALAYDGYQSFDEYGVESALVGSTSFSFDPASTNQATAAVATCSSTTGWTAVGGNATLAVSGTHFWDGTSSILVTPTASFAPITSPTVSASSLSSWVVSCYIYSATANVFGIGANYGGAYSTNVTVVSHPGGCWKRFTASVIVGSSYSAIGICVTTSSSFGSSATPYWIDAVQVETSTANGSPTAWQSGTSSRSNAAYTYPFNYYNPTGLTFSTWFAGNFNRTDGNSAVMYHINDTNGNSIMQTECFSTGQMDTTVNSSLSGGFIQTYSTVLTQWNHFVATYTGAAYTNSLGVTFPNLNIYLNSMLIGSATVTGTINTPGSVNIGHAYGSYNFCGRMDDVQVLPFGVDQAWVTGTYNASLNNPATTYGQTGLTPFLTMAGNAVDGAPIAVHGSIKQSTYVGFQDVNYGWISQGRSLQITLTEV